LVYTTWIGMTKKKVLKSMLTVKKLKHQSKRSSTMRAYIFADEGTLEKEMKAIDARVYDMDWDDEEEGIEVDVDGEEVETPVKEIQY
ncbi:hypothetical protein CP993_25680, partial [Escherichia coli]